MFRKILVGTDFSPESQRAADTAVQLAQVTSATVTLAHAWTPPVFPRPAGESFIADPVMLQTLERAAEDGLTAEKQRLAGRGVDVSTRALLGPEVDTLLHLAHSESFDLIVVGTHGRTGLKRLVLGSFAELIVRNASVPVLTVKLPEAS